jgi:adenylate cyclase
MKLLFKQELKSQFTGAFISGAVTAVFMYLLFYSGARSIYAGSCIGFFTYLGISAYSRRIEKRYLRKTSLFIVLLINSLVQVTIIFIMAWLFVGIFYLDGDFSILTKDFSRLFSSYFIIGVIFGLLLSLFFNFYSIVSTLIGQNILGKLFLGMYRNPVETDRVFMFLDIVSSTSIAEKTGHLKFLSLINDFFTDVSEPIRQTKGEIYKYVGDQVIVTWKTKDAIKDANCIRCFLLIDALILQRSEIYLNKYGIIPGYKAALHGGLVVTGELGYVKREIAYMGDVLNTTARIEEACSTYNKRLLISEYLLNQLELPAGINSHKVGNVKLRGKENELGLYSIDVNLKS